MAVYRRSLNCPNCGKPYKSKHSGKGKHFFGDSFSGWDYAGHKCNPLIILIKKVKNLIKK